MDLIERSRIVESTFTEGVMCLQSMFPNERIRDLGQAIWDVFHNRHVSLALGADVASLTFMAFGSPSSLHGVVLVPPNWVEMVKEDELLQLGAIFMVGAQAVDFYNGRIQTDGSDVIGKRAKAYEAEYLRALALPDPNPYQAHILQEFPSFDPAFEYVRKPA